MKTISNKDFLEKYNDEYNTRLMNKVSNRYRTSLSEDEIESCKMVAVWKTMIYFNPSKKTKFVTYLYRVLKTELNKALPKTKHVSLNFKVGKHSSNETMIDFYSIIDDLDPELKDIAFQYFVEKKSAREICLDNDIKCIFSKIKKIRSILQFRLS